MFFKKKSAMPQPAQEEAWDERTVGLIAESDSINVTITSITKRFGFGSSRPGSFSENQGGIEISGILTYPKFVLVNVALYDDEGEFGCFSYNRFNALGDDRSQGLPMLEIALNDPKGRMGEAMLASHQAALRSGGVHSLARFWKREGDGRMSDVDREKGWSYEGRYALTGMYSWAVEESKKLPAWAVPYASERFSIEKLPSGSDLLRYW